MEETKNINSSNTSLVNTSTQIAEFRKYDNMADVIEYVKPLVGTNQRFKTAADMALAMIYAKDVGIPPSFAWNHCYVLNGVVGADYHVLNALLTKNNVIVTEIEDCRPLYTFNSKDFVIDQDNFDANEKRYQVFGSVAEFTAAKTKSLADEKLLPIVRSADPYDYRTILEAKRVISFNKKTEIIVKRVSFSYSDAIKAGLVERNPHTWNAYLKDMLYSKALIRIARRIGNDIVHGVTELGELFDINNVSYRYDVEEATLVTD